MLTCAFAAAQAIPVNKRSSELPAPLTKADIQVQVSAVGSNMVDDYVMFTDFKNLPKESCTAYGKLDRSKINEPIMMPRPKYLGKADFDAFLDWVCENWNQGMIPRTWLQAKAKNFNGERWPSLQMHKEKNLGCVRGARAQPWPCHYPATHEDEP